MASSPLDVMKSYLVSLGFSVDKSSFESATHAIDKVSTGLSSFAGNTVKQFAVAGVAVASFVATALAGMSKFLNDLGNAQIKYEMLARQMWTTQQNAEAFDTTLKAMGTNLQQLYLSPTLMQQFQELHSQAFQMMPPAEFQQQMQFIQSITFEFKRMKLEGTYALQWIGYYFIKYMAGPITDIKTTLSHVNDVIIKTMPYWTKVVAEVMSWFGQFGITTVEAIKDISQVFSDIGQSIPNNIKLIGLAIAGLAIIASTGPVGALVATFTGLGLAINDFFSYLHGGQSEFGVFWQKLIDLYTRLKDKGVIDKFKNAMTTAFNDASTAVMDTQTKIIELYQTMHKNGTINDTKKSFNNFFEIISKLTNDQIDLFDKMFNALDQSGILKSLGDDFIGVMSSVSNLTGAVTGLINKILGLKGTNTVIKDLGDIFINAILSALRKIDQVMKEVITGMFTLSDIFQGKWGDAWKNFKSMITGSNLSASKQSYIYPSSTNHHTNNNSKVTVNNTNNIYGSDPKATASAATNNLTTVLRNTKGVIY